MSTNIENVERSYEDLLAKPEGFISAYLHPAGALEFVPYGDDPTHGYHRILREAVVDERHVKNLIVTNASKFIAKRMRPGASWGTGISYLEVGTGVGTGTTQVPQAENLAQTALRVPLLRKAISAWTNLDSGGVATGTDTNVLQITTTFLEAEANGAIVEMGLFGGDATATNGSGQMFNYKTFPVLNKDNTMQLTLVWKLTF
jgi:hypothetical protein